MGMKVLSSRVPLLRRRLFCSLSLKSFYRSVSKWIQPTGHSTGITVYNSATKCKVPLILKNKNVANWYMCGPTVYDSAHLGHACCYVKFDIIHRILTNFFDINVVLVMGITDIDDKIIARSCSLKEDVRVVSNRYENEFYKDMDHLNILAPTVTVRVTDIIPIIVRFVENILNKGMAYKADDGSVYFNTTQHEQYGKLNPIVHDDASTLPYKKSMHDFALWKAAKHEEPSWHSPWGQGRPGWHIECSAIASNILGSTIDIHSGGIDLLFPHHENEEAQSCSYHGIQQWVNYWLHTGHLHLKNDEKMSKSLKNTISISEFLISHTANHFRMYCLLSHYRNDVEYSDKILEYAKAICRKIDSFLSECDAYVTGIREDCDIHEEEVIRKLTCTKQTFLVALADDFDTASALGILLNFISEVNTMLHTPSKMRDPNSRCPGVIAAVSSFIQHVTRKLGLDFGKKATVSHDEGYFTKITDLVVNFRSEVRELALKNFKLKNASDRENDLKLIKACDKLRNNLTDVGIEIKDHAQKSSWNMKQG